jgi:hypothetical protein
MNDRMARSRRMVVLLFAIVWKFTALEIHGKIAYPINEYF